MQGGWQPPPPGGARSSGYGAPPHGYGSPHDATGGYGAPGPYGTYEFNALENAILAKTASRAKQWGLISTIFGALQIVGSCGMVAKPVLGLLLPEGVVALVVGIVFMGVGSSLESVVRTQGSDIPHLMQAMQKLGSAFTVQVVCKVIGVVLFAAAMMFLVFVAAVAAAGGD